MSTLNERIYAQAEAELGTVEWAKGSNPEVVKYYGEAGHTEIVDDSVPWCAAFVGAVLARSGVQGTGSLMARSYTNWGEAVPSVDHAQKGDLVVLSRGKDPRFGHVGFYNGKIGNQVRLLGGNQSDQVSVAQYAANRIVAIRRATAQRETPAQSKTVQASAAQIASGAGAGIAAVGALDGAAQIIAIAFAGFVILTGLWILRERLQKWARGVK
jgi:uncharacterized protein (TIGR02594 family)